MIHFIFKFYSEKYLLKGVFMDTKIIVIYCFCHDLLNHLNIQDDPQCKMNTAEVMTVGIIAALFFGGNIALSRQVLSWNRYIVNMLSESRLNRKIHAIDISVWQTVFFSLSQIFHNNNSSSEYIVDSFPVEVCANVRSYRCRLLKGKQFIGFCKAKKKYYYGFKVHVITTLKGSPIEFIITPASTADITAFKIMDLYLPEGSTIYADKAYNDYEWEDYLLENDGIRLVAQRKSNAKRQHNGPLSYIQSIIRKKIETTFSKIINLFPRTIHAVTRQGFILKMVLFIISFSLNLLLSKQAPA